jgi:hypothetical protein
LQKSLFFYEAQRSGRLPANNRVGWRGDSALSDGADVGLDLTGGYYDAGDHVKFGLPMFSTLTLLAWGGLEYRQGFAAMGQLDELLAAVRWGTDWIIRANPAPNILYGQVGLGGPDHSFWGAAEVMTMARPSFAITAQKPGTELAGEAAAALAASSMLFASSDPTYAAQLLSRARQLFTFADQYRGTYIQAIPDAANFYNSYSGFHDELVWAAAWLYRATGEAAYLEKAEAIYGERFAGSALRWTHNWDDKLYGSVVLLAQITGKSRYRTDAERWLGFWDGGGIRTTPGGLAWLDTWGSLRYAATTAFLAGVYADKVQDPSGRYARLAQRQIDYILGDNPARRSYVVGFGQNPPKNPHHRGAHGSWSNNINNPPVNRNVLYGALVGGPSSASDSAYVDDRTDYIANEVALDYNAGFTGALARLAARHGGTPLADFPPPLMPDDEFFVEAAITREGTNFTEIRAYLNNRSAFPPGASDFLSFRIYLDLRELIQAGLSPSQLVLSSAFNEGAVLRGPFLQDASRSLYYIEADFTGTRIAPGSSRTFRKEIQIRLALPTGAPNTAWNRANDPSLAPLTIGTPTLQRSLPVFQEGELLGGTVP